MPIVTIIAIIKEAVIIGPDAVKAIKACIAALHEKDPFSPEAIAAMEAAYSETAEQIDARQFAAPIDPANPPA